MIASVDVDHVMHELEALGTAHTKKSYSARGVREPFFGVPTGAMKPLKRAVGIDQPLADRLWATGNYDAMYFAGMIADVEAMTEADFERWIEGAYCSMLSDFVVAVTLAESPLAQQIAQKWIHGADESRASAGWACYEWLLGWRPDPYFDQGVVSELLDLAGASIHGAPPRVMRAMRNFVIAAGVSFAPLHEHALVIAERIGEIVVDGDGAVTRLGSPAEPIRAAVSKGRLGFKRRSVRC